MKIGMIGTGQMGTPLGRLWAEKGHQVFFGSRQLEPLAFLWIYLAYVGGQGPQTALKWVKR